MNKIKDIFLSICIISFFIPSVVLSSDLSIQTSRDKTKRIVGGSEVKRAFWPWMAALINRNISSIMNAHFCGGVLIHPQWILTAGHCVEELLPYDIEVILNIHDLETDQGDHYPIRQVIIHPEYDGIQLENDLALIQLKNAAPYPTIQPMVSHDIPPDTTGITIGWGKLSELGPTSSKLQQVSVPVVSNEVCQASFQKFEQETIITPGLLCAGYENGGKDACQGDSGGPLILHNTTHWILAGIVSWGQGCARPGYYGVYTRVSMYIDFIEQYVPTITIAGQVKGFIIGPHLSAIPLAAVHLINTEYKTYTDENGYYSLNVPSGVYNVAIYAEHYLPAIQVINLSQRKNIVYYNPILSIKKKIDIDSNGILNMADIIATFKRIIKD